MDSSPSPLPPHDCYLPYICWHLLQSSFKRFKPWVIPFPLRGYYAAKWGRFSWRKNFSWSCLAHGREQSPLGRCSMHPPASAVQLRELGNRCRRGVGRECLSLGRIPQKGPEVAIGVWGMPRQGRSRLQITSSLCCDSPLPHGEGSNESPARSLHSRPSLLTQCLIVPQSNPLPVRPTQRCTWVGVRSFHLLPLMAGSVEVPWGDSLSDKAISYGSRGKEGDVVHRLGRTTLTPMTTTTLRGLLGLACCRDGNLPGPAISAAGRLMVPLPGWHPPDWQGSFARMETASSEQLVISALLFAAIKSRTMAPVHLNSLAGINMPYGKEICRGGGQGRGRDLPCVC